jgi:pilus assembly protein CpaC
MMRFMSSCSTWRCGFLAALLLTAGLGQANAQTSVPVVTSDVTDSQYAGELIVPLHKSRILRLDQPYTDVFVSDPKISDVLTLTDRTLHVLGKELGSTTLAIYGRGKRMIAVMDLTVSYDVEGLKRRLHEVAAGERVEVRPANGSLVLSGAVSSTAQLNRILSVAERYAPESVTNLLTVEGSQQVMLAVRFAEMKRSAAKELGFNTNVNAPIGDVLFQVLTGAPSLTAFGTLGLSTTFGDVSVDVLLDALEEQRVLKTLAEPNLIALSGETANFLAGGEFPVPVAQDTEGDRATITIEFKEFGVRLAFTPTVLGDELINLVVEPEVSAIDPTTSIVLSGFSIPGLTTRRAKTSVDLKDGQSFAIAGLIQSDFEDTVQQYPGLADVPIVGALFRSADFQRSETELVIIVTPHLVKPARPGDLVLPTDTFVPPSEFDLFGRGIVETAAPDGSPQYRAPAGQGVDRRGGLDGRVGHIIR